MDQLDLKSEWKYVPLNEVIDLVIDYRGKTPKKLGGDWSNHGYRALSAKNIKTGEIVQLENIRYVDSNLYKKWMKDEIQRCDILLTSEAPFGEVYYWDSDEKIVLSQRLFALRCKAEFYPPYVYHYMTTMRFQAELRSRATGTTVTGLRQPELLKCGINCPEYSEQVVIADTLSTIEKRIAINKTINHNLEQQCFALYRHLFIEEAMPEWETGTIVDLGEVVGGSTPSKAKVEYYAEQGIAWITPKDLSINKNKFISRGAEDITELGLRNSSAQLMPRGTALFSSRAPIGYIAIANGEVCTNQGFKSVIPKKSVGTAFVYFFLKDNIQTIESMASGSTFKEVSGSIMKSIPAIIPDVHTLTIFNNACAPIFEQQELLEQENAHLVMLRDTLLPHLMSGELSITDLC